MQYGISVNLTDPAIIEFAGMLGYDFVWIDAEHSCFPNLGEMIRAAEAVGIEPWVRVASNESYLISAVLNLGAKGVIIPHISTRTEAEKAVQNTKFHPVGLRNWFSKARDANYGLKPVESYVAERNATVRLIVQIEEPDGIANAEEILAVLGVDMVMTGPGDLAQCLGIPGQVLHPSIRAAEETVFAAADKLGKPVMHFASSEAELKEINCKHPVEYLVIASDTSMLISALGERLSQLKAVVAKEK